MDYCLVSSRLSVSYYQKSTPIPTDSLVVYEGYNNLRKYYLMIARYVQYN
jgi:hypothetical protein